MLRFFFVYLLITIANAGLSAQDNPVIRIIDKSTQRVVPYANVCFQSRLNKEKKSFAITNEAGEVENSSHNLTEIAISYVGYRTYIDTIKPGQSYTIYIEPTQINIDELVVTGQLKPKLADESVYKIDVIGRNEIENKAAVNLADALALTTSLKLNKDGALGTGITMQGLSGEHVKILIDGVPVIGRQNGTLDLDQISMQNIDHVEIIQGSMSVIYGSNAMAGVINLITRKNNRPKISSTVNSYYETIGKYDFGITTNYRYKKHTFNLGGNRVFFDGYSPENLGRFSLWKPKLQYGGNLNYGLTLKKTTLGLGVTYFNEELRDKGEPDSQFDYLKAFDAYHFTNRLESRLELTHILSEKTNFQLLSSYSRYQKRKNTYLMDLVSLEKTLPPDRSLHDTTIFNAVVNRGVFNYAPISWISFQAGYDINTETAVGKRLVGTKEIGDYAAFLSFQFSPWKKLTIQPGVRTIYNTNYKAPLVHALSLLWNENNYSLRFSYGRGFRAPSLKELYLEFIDANHNVLGNENLKAENGQNLNLSGDYSKSFGIHKFSIRPSLFYNELQNKIDLLIDPTDPAGTKATYFNVSEGDFRTRGLELECTYNFHPRFELTLGYFKTGKSKLNQLNEYAYSTDYSAKLSYLNLKYGFKINAYYKYNGKIQNFYGLLNVDGNIDVREGYRDSYHNMDITLARSFFNNTLDIGIGTKNLFNIININSFGNSGTVHGDDGANEASIGYGRTFFIKVAYNFVKY